MTQPQALICDTIPTLFGRYGSAITLGHPLGASGAHLATIATSQLHRVGGRYASCTMCIGVGQDIAAILVKA